MKCKAELPDLTFLVNIYLFFLTKPPQGVAGFITSITWIASYLSFAANACGAAVNSGALCAGDWTALMANFGEMATAAWCQLWTAFFVDILYAFFAFCSLEK